MRALVLLLCVFASQSVVARGVAWRSDPEAARLEARQSGRLLLLHFFSDQCVWCERLEQGVFLRGDVQQAIEERYVPVKIHGPSNPAWVQAFRIQSYPTDVLLTPDGDLLARQVSPQEPAQFMAMLQRPGKPMGHSLAAAPRAEDIQDVTAGGQVPPDQFVLPRSDSPTAAYSGGPSFVQPPTSTPSIPAFPVSAQLAGPVGGGHIPAADDGSVERIAKAGQQFPASQTNRVGTASGRRQKSPMLDGYCPVSMIENERWVEGKVEFGVVHLGEVYFFANVEAQQKFLENPTRFAPVLNGIDVVRFVEDREIVAGTRAYGWTDPQYGGVFLFSGEETAVRFRENFDYYARQAMEIMDRALAEQAK